MSIFGAIKNAIFGHKAAAPAAQAPTQAQAQSPAMPQMNAPQAAPAATAAPQQSVDVDAVLASIAAQKGQKLNYETSIVDLMKLLDLDPSLANREALAGELGYTGAKDGSAQMNVWLHKRVMEELAKNGGKVSPALAH